MRDNNDLEYYFGLSGYSFWKRVNGCYMQSVLFSNGLIRVIECNVEDKTMLVKSRHLHESDWIGLYLSELVRNVTIDINEYGERWEGDSLNGVPFGYGCFFSGDNIVVYHGFLFEGKHVCYGEEFYNDTGEIMYEGDILMEIDLVMEKCMIRNMSFSMKVIGITMSKLNQNVLILKEY